MQLWLIPVLPLLGFLVNGIFGRRFSKPAVNAVAIGSVALSFLWVVKTLLGLSPLDPWSLATAALLLAAVGFAAGYLPARRAAATAPLLALRTE